ncbi:hypothetical protein IAU59_007296 [Kwoniella sp. CBS 9459]
MSSLLEESHIVPSHPGSGSTSGADCIPPPPPPPPPPIESWQFRQPICGVETELLVQTFDDRVFVVVTQNGKVGCLTQASLPAQIPLLPPPPPPPAGSSNPSSSASSTPASASLQILSILPPPSPALSLTPLLGSPPDATLHDLYISQIATLVFFALESGGNARRPVVVGLSLKTKQYGSHVDEYGDEHEDAGGLQDDERERYAGIMGLVSQWPGPSGQ